MKNYLFIILAAIAICYAGCKKDPGNGAPSSADSYMPVTAGSTWTYFVYEQGITDTLTVKMSGVRSTLYGKIYYNATNTSKPTGVSTSYFYIGKHLYATRDFNPIANSPLELQIYNDTATINHSWISSPTDSTSRVNGILARVMSTIRQTGEVKVFLGKTFTNVIHTQVDFQYNFGSGYATAFTYDYYLAKGIGILGYNLSSLGGTVKTEGIISYNVK
jgi:hypothetical protein